MFLCAMSIQISGKNAHVISLLTGNYPSVKGKSAPTRGHEGPEGE